ncbi:DEAD/DEAH box helicase [Mycoplasma sp. P36-A1]|uniref:DEAD/DEAH box helicase n=1 Tax=Mycoplasma sp. P36-A1 TaxID=3252900 RepID=UPI003C2B274A
MNFSEIITNEQLLKGIEKMGFVSPSEIQEKVIPVILEGKDVIGHAKTGTGKTAAFTLPILERADFKANKGIKTLVLVPTRELAKQVKEEIDRLGKYVDGLKTAVVYGGSSYSLQRTELKRNPGIVVATPGRLIDLIDRKYLSLDTVEYLVLDEADEMLSIGFATELEKIESHINKERQTLLFSATFNDGVYKLSKRYLTNPTKISVVTKDKIASTIEQKYMLIKNNEKMENLVKVLTVHQDELIMVFANTKREVDGIVEGLQTKGIMAEAIHGDLSQKMRENVLAKFKKGITKVLVCSDVAARGLDIKGVEVVINMDLPFENEYYVHRVGRTGRAESTGIAYTILNKNKERRIKSLAKELKTDIKKVEPIKASDIANIAIENKLNELETYINNSKADHLEKIQPLIEKGHDLDSIFHGLLAMQFDTMIVENNGREESDDIRLFVNLGKKDRVTKKDLSKIFNLGKDEMYDIDIKATFTFCTVNVNNVDGLINKVKKQKFNKRSLNVEIANN